MAKISCSDFRKFIRRINQLPVTTCVTNIQNVMSCRRACRILCFGNFSLLSNIDSKSTYFHNLQWAVLAYFWLKQFTVNLKSNLSNYHKLYVFLVDDDVITVMDFYGIFLSPPTHNSSALCRDLINDEKRNLASETMKSYRK